MIMRLNKGKRKGNNKLNGNNYTPRKWDNLTEGLRFPSEETSTSVKTHKTNPYFSSISQTYDDEMTNNEGKEFFDNLNR